MPAIIQHQLLGMKANVVSYNAIIDGVHAMGPHRLLATSGCDIGIEFLIVIVMVSFVFECCMFGASARAGHAGCLRCTSRRAMALFAGAQAAADNGKKVARRKALSNLRVSYITFMTCILFVA